MSSGGGKKKTKTKEDFLNAIFNVKQYTKNLKKTAQNFNEDSDYAVYSYDEIPTHTQIPQSAKLPKQNLNSFDYIPPIKSYKDDTSQNQITTKKSQMQVSKHMTKSSNEVEYIKIKKSSFSNLDESVDVSKTRGKQGKSLIKFQQYKRHSPDRIIRSTKQNHQEEKYSSYSHIHEGMGRSYGGEVGRKDSFMKLKSKKSFNYSNQPYEPLQPQDFESQKLSYQNKSLSRKNSSIAKMKQKNFVNNKADEDEWLSAQNFNRLLKQIQRLQVIIQMYQEAMKEMRKKFIQVNKQNKQNKLQKLFIESLKQNIEIEQKKNDELRQTIESQSILIKQFQQRDIKIVEKISQKYEKTIKDCIVTRKQNQFLKYMLKLQQNPQQNVPYFREKSTQVLPTQSTQNIFLNKQKFKLCKNFQQLKQSLHKSSLHKQSVI